jgi:phage replication-related protein YjqB (UPF0714/DUF867 family)
MRAPVPADELRSYADLARRYTEGVDYGVHARASSRSPVAILAPHGGRIENGTSEIARLIAGEEHALYLFEGWRASDDNFDHLHLASHCFDEPRCLDLIAECSVVVAVHGYAAPGPDVLLGGRDEVLKRQLTRALTMHGVSFLTEGHRFPGRDVRNVCNRGRAGQGLQLELSARLRRTREWTGLVHAVRSVLGIPDGEVSCRSESI